MNHMMVGSSLRRTQTLEENRIASSAFFPRPPCLQLPPSLIPSAVISNSARLLHLSIFQYSLDAMSLSSTTTTTTFAIVKYSRAYTQSTTPTVSQSDLEWQHFSNPVIRLTLDIKKSPEGRLESYRLRIVWSFSAGVNSMDVDEREVIFVSRTIIRSSSSPQRWTRRRI